MPVNESFLSLAKTIVLLSKESPKTTYLRVFCLSSEDDGDDDDFTVTPLGMSWLLRLCYHKGHVPVTDFGQVEVEEGGDVLGTIYRLQEKQYSFNRFKIDKSGTALFDFVTTWQASLPESRGNLGVPLEKRQVSQFTQDGSIHLEMGEGITLYQHKYRAHEPESLTRLLVAMIQCGWAYSSQDALKDIPQSVHFPSLKVKPRR